MLNVTIISMHAPYPSDTLLAMCTEKQNAVKSTNSYYLVHWKSLAKCNYICIYGLSEFAVVIVNLLYPPGYED